MMTMLSPLWTGTRHPVHRSAFNQLFDIFDNDFGLTSWSRPEPALGTYVPRLDMTETEKEVRVTAELPGLDEKDIQLSFTDNTLTLKGEKKSEHEEKKESFYRLERSYGSFDRSIKLPAEIQSDKISARFKKGVLMVTLPKSAEAKEQTRNIKIQGG